MCIFLKLHYAKFDVSRLFCSKFIEEKPLGGRLDLPTLGKGRVNRCMSESPFTFLIKNSCKYDSFLDFF